MTAEAFAELLGARLVGRGKWTARCPAHGASSLAIKRGTTAVLLHCWSQGCTVEQVCDALGLSVRDLFNDSSITPEMQAEGVRNKILGDEQECFQRDAFRLKRDRVCNLQNLVEGIGARLARRPEDPGLGFLFHRACNQLHVEKTQLYRLVPERGRLRMAPPTAIPLGVAPAHAAIHMEFDKDRGPLETGREGLVGEHPRHNAA